MRKPIQDRWPLSFALLGVVALLSLGARGCPPATPEIPVGTDCWETNPDATVWTHKGAFPAGFFGGDPKSNAIPHPPELHFAGNPLTPDEVKACGCPEKVDTKVKWLNRHGDETTDIRHAVTQVVELTTKVDTCVRREQRAEFPGKGASAKVDIELLQLSLKSASPITVEYKDGSTKLFDAFVTESATQKKGSMTFTAKNIANGKAQGDMKLGSLPIFFEVVFKAQDGSFTTPPVTGSLNFKGTAGSFSQT